MVEAPAHVLGGLADAVATYSALEPDVERLAPMAVSQTLPLLMSRDLGVAAKDIGGWMSFLFVARPAVLLCGREGDRVSICLDYGGQDVFQVDLAPHPPGWAPTAVTWWQTPPAAAPAP